MNGMRGKLLQFAAMAMMFDAPMNAKEKREIDFTPKIAPIPKGCKEYWFNKDGIFSNGGNDMLKSDVVFYCVAASDKSAIKKFNKFIS